ncbi:MAG: sortase [Defluviitaleaceae bacterium]|nr:sortase [Defluviitaleaceae bacterium]
METYKQLKSKLLTSAVITALSVIAFAVMLFIAPVVVRADNTAWQNNNFTNPNWQNMHDYDHWNWRHNWAYHAPQYQFETTFPVDQWARPTTSNVAPQHTQNIRRDRHASFLPPSHGVVSGFYSGEFVTNRANPFAPQYNNNPNASRATVIEESVFAVRPGEAGVNVRADGTHAGGFLASTGTMQSGGGNSGVPQGETTNGADAPWTAPGTQVADGFTVTHRPIQESETGVTQAGSQQNRVTAVTPFSDGTIGRITIPALNNRTASVRPGLDLATLDYYVGHFSYTSQWDGNVALASHNRGRGSFFAGIWTLQGGDRIFYETTLGVRAFEVISIEQISENDLGNLDHSQENILTLVTCVYGQPSLRWSVRAREVL